MPPYRHRAKGMAFHPVFRIRPSEPPTNGGWVAHLGGDPASCRTWLVSSRNLSGGGGHLVGDFPNVLHRLRHWARGHAFTVEVEPEAATALGVPAFQEFPATAEVPPRIMRHE